ncbi:MAG: Zn-dependent metalloprotease [Bacteroidia bacterium]|jgi:Zn-dependent metalloprotease
MVRIEKGSAIPRFVRLKESPRFPYSNFPAWVKKALKLERGIEFMLIRNEADKFGFQHHHYQKTKNGIAVFGAFAFAHSTNDMVASVNGRMPATISNSTASLSENSAPESAKNHRIHIADANGTAETGYRQL